MAYSIDSPVYNYLPGIFLMTLKSGSEREQPFSVAVVLNSGSR